MWFSGLKNVPSLPGQTCPAEAEACRGKERPFLTGSLWPCVLCTRLPPSTWPLTRSRHLRASLWDAPQPTGVLTKQCATPSRGPLGRSVELLPVGSTSEGVSLQDRAVREYRPCSAWLYATPTRRHHSPGHPDGGWPEHSPTPWATHGTGEPSELGRKAACTHVWRPPQGHGCQQGTGCWPGWPWDNHSSLVH